MSRSVLILYTFGSYSPLWIYSRGALKFASGDLKYRRRPFPLPPILTQSSLLPGSLSVHTPNPLSLLPHVLLFPCRLIFLCATPLVRHLTIHGVHLAFPLSLRLESLKRIHRGSHSPNTTASSSIPFIYVYFRAIARAYVPFYPFAIVDDAVSVFFSLP